MKLTRSEWNGA